MHLDDIRKLNLTIATSLYLSVHKDLADACRVFGIDKEIAKTIESISMQKMEIIASSFDVILQPGKIPSSTWATLIFAEEDSIHLVQILANE